MIKTNKVGVEMLQILSRNGNNAVILCRCPICGQLFSMQRSHFYRGSNGCRCRLPISERLYSIWTNIKTRCNNPNSTCSKYYHDKGITNWSVHIHIPYKTLMSFYYRHSKDETIQYINDRIKQLGGEV